MPVYIHQEILPGSTASVRGKGEALWKSLHVLTRRHRRLDRHRHQEYPSALRLRDHRAAAERPAHQVREGLL